MKTKIENLENNLVKINIEIEADVAEKEYNKACKRLAQRVNIPGFRKGKAPRAILEKNLGVNAIKNDALEGILPETFANIIQENNLNVITEPRIESCDFNIGSPVMIIASVELKPEVKFEQYKGIDVEVEQFKTAENAMEREINELLEKFSTMQTVKDRAANDSDIVMIDFTGYVDGEPIKNGDAKNYMLDLGHSNFIKGFAEAIVGHSAGEEFTIDVTFPEEYHDENLKGKPAQFKIVLNEIKERVLPELNDELAKKVGNFKTVDELKADIQKYLDNTEKVENDKRSANKVFDVVLSKMSVQVQDTMIQREKEALIAEFKQKLSNSGVSWDEVLKNDGAEKVNNELYDEALNRIKNSLMLAEIAKLEKIQVTPQDLDEKLGEMAAIYHTNKDTIFNEIRKNPGMIQSLTQQALSQKVTRFLIDNNNIKFVEEVKK